MSDVVKYFIQLLIALSGAYLVAFLALKKMYEDKLWDKKYNAYVNLIEAFNDYISYCASKKDNYEEHYEGLGDSDLYQRYAVAHGIILKSQSVGALLLPDNVMKELECLKNREVLDFNTNPIQDYYEEEYKVHVETLNVILPMMKNDLRGTS